MSLQDQHQTIKNEISKVIFGQEETIDLALAALFSCGHVLIEGPPGVAKTLLVRTIATTLDLQYSRVQMTPDLLPNDITGTAIYREDEHRFEFRSGPVFTNFLLADEINRASSRTQSALLEAMQELQVTYDSVAYDLPQPFMTFATENPIEQEGTYPLPLAQLDRFMFKVLIDYPDGQAEERILKEHHATGGRSNPALLGVQPVMDGQAIIAARQEILETFVRDEVVSYVRSLTQETRDNDRLFVGASPRAGLMLLMGAKSLARFAGRDYVIPDDIQEAFLPAMRHRVVLSPSAELEGTSVDDVLLQVLDDVEVPR